MDTLYYPIRRAIKYQFHAGKIIENFKIEKEKLNSEQKLVKEIVEAAVRKNLQVSAEVWHWLHVAEKLIQEGMQMEMEIERNTKSNCFLQTCFAIKHIQQYDEMQKKMEELSARFKFDFDFDPSIPIPSIDYFSFGNLVCFQSTEEASNQLFNALKDDSSYIIGLHGMRGSGKTELVKALGEKAKFLKIFDEVIFVTVSQDPNVKRIQDEIADWLDLKLHRNAEAIRARSISETLKGEKRILVILDDVRAKLELKDIGIPYNSKQCKVLLTTRHQDVCTSMECEREIPLHPLPEEEAWKLFKKNSGIDEKDESSSNLLEVASKVAIECKGLPGKIKDIGSSLRRKPIEEWEATLDGLRLTLARYQVFISFRGRDTRYSFTGFLYDALCREGFKTFMDEGGLESGDQISQSLVAAIEDSRLSIIVLSENYASSAWCLEELVTIVECKQRKNQLVWPIFYKVEPTDIRYQKNSYGKAMEAHEKRFGKDSEKVEKWRSALFEVAGLSGDHYTTGTGYEYRFIQEIVKKVHNNKSRLHIQSMDMD